jgi:hypothetical protein
LPGTQTVARLKPEKKWYRQAKESVSRGEVLELDNVRNKEAKETMG